MGLMVSFINLKHVFCIQSKVEHKKMKFVSVRVHVIVCLLPYKLQTNELCRATILAVKACVVIVTKKDN